MCNYLRLLVQPLHLDGGTVRTRQTRQDTGINVPGENPKALAEAIIQLSELSTNARQRMGKRAQAFAIEHFVYAVIARRLAAEF